jgi:hypothetical protein
VKKPPTIIAAVGTARNRRGPARTIVAAVGKAGKGDKPGRYRTGVVGAIGGTAEQKGPWVMRLLETGAAVGRAGPKRGRKPNVARNIKMAREYLQRRAGTGKSDTALKVNIGKNYGLGRRASINAVNAGLKTVCSKTV